MIISVPCTNFHIALSQVKYIVDINIIKKNVLLGYAIMYDEPYAMFGISFCLWQKGEFDVIHYVILLDVIYEKSDPLSPENQLIAAPIIYTYLRKYFLSILIK